MRIAYGVMGYGRGHAMRALSVLPALMKQHEVTVFTAGDAHAVLAAEFPTVRIPMLGYRYNAHGSHSTLKTVTENLSPLADLLWHGEGVAAVEREFKLRGIQVVISDSEAWCHKAAQRLRLPRISFDHVGILAYCQPHFPPPLWLTGMRDAIAYRSLMGIPERILISSFYPAVGRYPGVKVVGPMLRDIVKATRPKRGDYLLAYFNKGEHQYRPHIDRALRQLDCPVRVYGTKQRGQVENLEFQPLSNEQFVQDLAGCRAVLSTAGNQLIGEAIHFGKPILALPEDAFEQRLNAHMIERMGVGMQSRLSSLTPSDIDRFMANEQHYRGHMREHQSDGRDEAVTILNQFIEQLSAPNRVVAKANTQAAAVSQAGLLLAAKNS